MMQYEFERLAQREVTSRQYEAIETLYNESDLDKVDFVESIRGLLEHLPEPPIYRQIVYVVMTDRKTGNIARGRHGGVLAMMAEIAEVDIETGKTTLRSLSGCEKLMEIDRIPEERIFYSDNPRLDIPGLLTWKEEGL